MPLSRLLTTFALAAALAPALHAQTQTPEAADAAIRTRLKSDLRNLVVAQESYFASHNAYADILANLAYRPSTGSDVSLVATQNNSWGAVATDASWPGKSCIIFINLAEKYRPKTMQEKRGGETSDEGRPMCDGDPKTEK